MSKFSVFFVHVFTVFSTSFMQPPKGCFNALAIPNAEGTNILTLILSVGNTILSCLIPRPTTLLHSTTRHGSSDFDVYSGIHIVEVSIAVGHSNHELPSILM